MKAFALLSIACLLIIGTKFPSSDASGFRTFSLDSRPSAENSNLNEKMSSHEFGTIIKLLEKIIDEYKREEGTVGKREDKNNMCILSGRSGLISKWMIICRSLIHPDLFVRYPKEQYINETSLKSLKSYLEERKKKSRQNNLRLKFYVKKTSNK
ncbi:unnamed protein product [Lepeophtheirus salmonis]|uniref:(salmon louse) hypothetical protein n=1 Tax=Lepeophtheirus salmonis TaxID=72036 RepID=A0A7R8CY82_LEPSM|nr:unnamed protein product [Lepeophtheirus salmonis]CAF2967799.1 unnamed protein product [Lepeophtheirus salmonis]